MRSERILVLAICLALSPVLGPSAGAQELIGTFELVAVEGEPAGYRMNTVQRGLPRCEEGGTIVCHSVTATIRASVSAAPGAVPTSAPEASTPPGASDPGLYHVHARSVTPTGRTFTLGVGHGLAVRDDSTVAAWGGNLRGQLGNGASGYDAAEPLPIEVEGIERAVAVAAGRAYSLVLTADGTVWGFGTNQSGQLADGSTEHRSRPVRAEGPPMARIWAGQYSAFGVDSEGQLYGWGLGRRGGLGFEPSDCQHSDCAVRPTPVPGIVNPVHVAAGSHTLVLLTDGTVLSTGNNNNGQLGDGSQRHRSAPRPVQGFAPGTRIVAVATGSEHSLAVDADGRVWGWGNNVRGPLGDDNPRRRTTAALIPGITDAVDVAAGERHTLVLLRDGRVVAFGANSQGQLGIGTTEDALPTVIPDLENVVSIGAMEQVSYARLSDGTVRVWGANIEGQLADGGTDAHHRPVEPSVPVLLGSGM